MSSWHSVEPGEGVVILRIHVQPRSRRTEVVGVHGDALKIRVAAPALEDRANDALISFVAARFGVGRRDVTLLSGDKSREKRLAVRGALVAPESALCPGGPG